MSRLETAAAIGMVATMSAGVGVVVKWGAKNIAQRWLVRQVNPKAFGVASGVCVFAYIVTRISSDILGVNRSFSKKEKLNLKAIFIIHTLPLSVALLAYDKYEKLSPRCTALFVAIALFGLIQVIRATKHNRKIKD